MQRLRWYALLGPALLAVLSLAAGIAILALGALLVLERSDAIELSAGWIGAAFAAAAGSVLLVSGLSDDRGR